jgi:hypothetical protein
VHYSVRRYLLASLIAPLACFPIAFLVIFISFAVAERVSHLGPMLMGSAIMSAYALAIGYAAAVFVSAPAVLGANILGKSIPRGVSLLFGIVGGGLGAALFAFATGGFNSADNVVWCFLLGIPSGATAGLLFHAVLHRGAGA